MIDAHVHLWDLSARAQPWTNAFPQLQRSFWLDDLERLAAGCDVDGFIVVQPGDTHEESLELLALAAKSPLIAGVVGWVDLARGDVAEQLAELRAAPGGEALVGVRHQLQLERDPAWIRRPAVLEGLRAVARTDLCYDIVVSPEQLPLVIETVREVPELRFVLDHAGKPSIAAGGLARWREDIERLARCPGVVAKLSGLVTEADWTEWTQAQLDPVIDYVLACFGPQRTMAGSDWPVCLLAADYQAVCRTLEPALRRLSAGERADVCGGTAKRWYRRHDR